MIEALSLVWRSVKDFWDDFVLLVMMNMLWVLAAALPLAPLWLLGGTLPILALGLAVLLLLPLPVVTGGLFYVANQITRGVATSWETFATGVRRYWLKSLVVALINVVVLFLIGVNIRFYASVLEGAWAAVVPIVWLVLGVYWLLVQVFWFPMILELENEKTLLALRNASLMAIVTPGFSLVLFIAMALILALSIVLTVPIVAFTTVLLALIANHATRSRVAYARKEPYRPGPPD